MYVCYAADNNFSMLTGVSMLSVLQSTRERPICFFVLDGGITPENRDTLQRIADRGGAQIGFIDIDRQMQQIRAIGQKAWGDFPSHVTWARLFLPELLPPEVDRVLYLDGDTLAAGDLSELYHIDLDGNIIAAVEDCVNAQYKANLGLQKQARYVNAGMILFDLDAWRNSGPRNWITDLMQPGKVYEMADQDVLNLMFLNQIRFLPLKYNCSTWFRVLYLGGLRLLLEDRKMTAFSAAEVHLCETEKVIVHYNSCRLIVRPWYRNSTDPDGKLWQQIYAQSPWAQCPLAEEPVCLSRGERRDRRLYQMFGKTWYPLVHAVDYQLRKKVQTLLKKLLKGKKTP